jgi:WD40 repeat protein
MSIALCKDGFRLASRSADESVKLWDVRNFKKPVEATYNLASLKTSRLALSPKQDLLVVASHSAKEQLSYLHFFDTGNGFTEKAKIVVGQEHVTDVKWFDRIN